ncbi:MAG: phenylacetate--CoA ligase family protein [Candidatus Altiarchaeota archaeon]|nr:phenylacetate--CoA ligase family protein [Candidatus Altiarchaeota archaeon]
MDIYPSLFKRLVFPLMENMCRTDIQKRLKFLQETQWWDKSKLEKLQNERLRSLIHHAYDNVPYYRRLFRETKLSPTDIKTKEDLSKLPRLTKEIIRKNLKDMLATNIAKTFFVERHSSGSTGEPMKYFIDKNSYSDGWAQTFRCWSWAGYELGEPYVKVSLNPRMSKLKLLQDKLMNCTYMYASDINENTVYKKIDQIRMSKSKIIRGYPSSLYIMSKYMEDAGITNLHMDAITTTGDMLFPKYRNMIESKFHCKVFDGYGGENIVVSFECEKHDGYHICDEHVITEVLSNGEAVDYGELGEITLTSLCNYAMPFIRYGINDVGRPKKSECPCGRGLSMMEGIEGRDTDIIVTPKGDLIVVHFFTILFEYIEGVTQFQVIQDKIDRLRVKIVKNDRFTEVDIEHIKSKLLELMGENAEVLVDIVDEIPLAKSGKRRFVISKVPLKF